MDISAFNQKLGQRFKEIREKTGLNQEQFYEKYLKAISGRNRKNGTSYQDYMKLLENGNLVCPSSFIPVYANIAGISERDLIDFADTNPVKEVKLTYASVAKMLNTLMQKNTLTLTSVETNGGTKNALLTEDPILSFMLDNYGQFNALLKNGSVQQSIYDMIVDAFLKNFDDRLLNFGLSVPFSDHLEFATAMTNSNDDVAKAYRKVIEHREGMMEIQDDLPFN